MSTPWDPTTFNPHDPAFSRDPYPFYARFRETAPVCRVQPYGSWWVFRNADVRTVLEDTARFLKNNPNGGTPPPAPFNVLANYPQGLFSLDPPRHDQLRALLNPLFAQAIAGMDDAAATLARELLTAARGSQRIELYSAFAQPLPSKVLFKVLGMPDAAVAGLSSWVTAILAGHDITAPASLQGAAATCSMALLSYFQGLALGCPVHAGAGAGTSAQGLFGMMQTSVPTRGMSAEEVQTTTLNFAVAGYLSTTFLLATGTYNLLRNPEQLARLRADPTLAGAAVEEMLRYDAPAQLVDRYAAEDLVLGGVQLRKGDPITAVLGSANRDPEAFANPDAFDITRDNSRQLGFGDGIHHCIGAPLVRLVGPAALRTLLQELPTMRIDGLPQWQTDPYLRSVVNLPLNLA